MHEDYLPFVVGGVTCVCGALVVWKQLLVVAIVLVAVALLGGVAAMTSWVPIFYASPIVLLWAGFAVLVTPKLSTKGKVPGGIFILVAIAVYGYIALLAVTRLALGGV